MCYVVVLLGFVLQPHYGALWEFLFCFHDVRVRVENSQKELISSVLKIINRSIFC